MTNIHPDLLKFAVDINSIHNDPANARKHDEKNINAIKASLSKFGMRQPIIVQKDGMIVRAGNGRLQAARELGWDKIAAIVVDESNLDATAYSIADNQIATKAAWDYPVLSDLIKGLKDSNYDIDPLGFEDFELAPLLNADWTPPEIENDDDGNSEDMSFQLKFSDTQRAIIIQAIEKLNQDVEAPVSNEEAVKRICQRFLSGDESLSSS